MDNIVHHFPWLYRYTDTGHLGNHVPVNENKVAFKKHASNGQYSTPFPTALQIHRHRLLWKPHGCELENNNTKPQTTNFGHH